MYPDALVYPLGAATILAVLWLTNGVSFEMKVEASWIGLGLSVAVLAFLKLVKFRNQGPFRVSANGVVQLRGKSIATLDELGVPRVLLDHRHEYEVAGQTETLRGPFVVCERVGKPPLVLFESPTNRRIRKRIPELADRLNAIITEYDERRATEAWLEQRARELEAPCRKEGEPA